MSISTSVDHPCLTKADASSIRVFLRAYDQYVSEFGERARQFVAKGVVSSEPSTPVGLKFCVDDEWLVSLIDPEFFDFVKCYTDPSDWARRTYFDNKAKESKEFSTLDVFDDLLK